MMFFTGLKFVVPEYGTTTSGYARDMSMRELICARYARVGLSSSVYDVIIPRATSSLAPSRDFTWCGAHQ